MNRDVSYLIEVASIHFKKLCQTAGKQGVTYAQAFDEVLEQHPDFNEVLEAYGKDIGRKRVVKEMSTRYREFDRNEHEEPSPTPIHLRQGFLTSLGIEIPPVAASINAFNGEGRIAADDAGPRQHRRHRRELKQFHQRGVSYNAHAEEGWDLVLGALTKMFPGENLDQLSLKELLEWLKRQAENNDDQDTAPASITSQQFTR